jgi:uncharacterized membrane protein
MSMSPAVRKFALTIHLTCSVGWIGAVLAYLALGVAAVTNLDAQTVRAAWTGMEVIGWWVIVPLAIASLLTGLSMSLGTHWGLFRHYWVLISLALTMLCTVVLVLHMPTVSTMAELAQHADGADLRALGGDLFHPAVGLVGLLAIAVLNVYKPAGVTPYGWRKQREQRHGLQWTTRRAPSLLLLTPVAGTHVRQSSTRFRTVAAGVGYFTLHFAEMFVAMMVGMMVFVPFRLVLTAQGYTALLDGSSIDFQAWMAAFMVAPMLTWMRVRGCSWRNGAEMSAAMLLPIAAVIVLRGLGLADTLPWLSNAEHTGMFAGMLVLMLFRREHYTSGYSFTGRPFAAAERPSSSAQRVEAEQSSARAGAR